MTLIDRQKAEVYERQAYPGSLRARTNGCVKTKLSDAAGLTQIGCGEVTLAPGSATGLYHWHETEDEFVYILEGEVVLIDDGVEHHLRAGDSAGFKAGDGRPHTFENRGDKPARLIEVGWRNPAGETAHYPGYDLIYRRSAEGVRFEDAAGEIYSDTDEVSATESENR
ncbi:MAG: cupin domain-containing protein [Pseudomonadota bacterium]